MIISAIDPGQIVMPIALDDAIAKDSPIRLLKKFVKLVLISESMSQNQERSFVLTGSSFTGRPAYSTETMLLLLMFCFFRKVKSSRDLERATYYDLELKWLIGDLHPDHKTICEFKKLNQSAIKEFNKGIRKQLKSWKLLQINHACFDGSKLNAYAKRDMISLDSAIEELAKAEDKLNQYTDSLLADDKAVEFEIIKLKDEKARLESEIVRYKAIIAHLEESDKNYYSESDPDCNLMKFNNSGYDAGYNVQLGSDPVNKFISSEYVTDSANDQQEMRENINVFQEEHGKCLDSATFDSGYFNGDEIASIEKEEAIKIYSPSTKMKSEKVKFYYEAENDRYICSQGKYLTIFRRNVRSPKKNKKSKPNLYDVYACKDCTECPLKIECTKSEKGRQVTRYHNQEFRDKHRAFSKSDAMKEQMRKRKSTCEHVFGTMKRQLGYVPLLRKGKEKVLTDIRLFSSAYNIMRFINLIDFKQANAILDKALRELNSSKKVLISFIQCLLSEIYAIISLSHTIMPFLRRRYFPNNFVA